ncbi:hypothetical protein C343_02070 [Cryptococcus neoformans C23]|uniref:BAG domain-containing protein n=1 Tax=Cryptococcus neoformans (strain H99 / ATCC 208821 / CBS 10515 / FGSC 9487) TaxID=235443 RepID=J9VQM8_CRYN9|nr:hypothetical protein CNAG_02691 [Cryptococcus neoformans var. grubii H99]AUB23602.1 hypothetical protein CKF44_02691 [Cryptococcus neoformans var. grubii]OWZ33934.1 hypothetical protein C347_02138 [Cryptococcus neoformans var. grubii AD2-60a]OWZ46062.1 hypothetical protein C343_02070 [Cryptococcus neoformans var. grubii C23]OXG37035.1 hypothetical protein C360_02160 [Cryptococcus neoformans var. grubii Bt15]OXG44173.1 hypothetical protein C359_01280 [Cryptococcus neoformans var. grubii Bt12|eukprot:XP_012048069.1 hypothetical protein CNAG_02691 [Cryptococcus neoformans var. grubii H99]
MSLFNYPYVTFGCPAYRRRGSPSSAYHQSPFSFNPHYTTRYVPARPSYDLDDMMYAEEEEAAAYYKHLGAIQRKREAAQAAKRAREIARAQAQAEREAAIKAELERAVARKEEKQKRQRLRSQEEERRRRRAHAEAISRKKVEKKAREAEDFTHTSRSRTRDSHYHHRSHRVNGLDDLNSLFSAFSGINVAPQYSSASESEVESESEAASTSSTSSSEQAASPSHVEHVPREIEASAITSSAQNPSASPSVQVSSITPKADIPGEQVAEEEEEEEEEESTTISEESSASLASLASTEHQLATLKSSFNFPSQLSFAHSTRDSHPPPLLFNRLNAPYHAQTNALLQLLLQADSVESNGDIEVRNRRKDVVMKVQEEIAKLERQKDDMWTEIKGRRERGEESEPAADEERSWSDGVSVATEQ